MVDLDELERLERGATPGPWELEERMRGYGIFAGRVQDFGRGPERVHGLNLGHVSDLDANGEDNLALIIAARNALPDLLAELRALRARVAEMERDAIPCPACGDPWHRMSCHVRSREAIERYLDELKRDARIGATVAELVEAGEPDDVVANAVRGALDDRDADTLRAEEVGEHG